MISFLFFGKERLKVFSALWDCIVFFWSKICFWGGFYCSWNQEFNFGLEFVLLMSFVDDAAGCIDDALASLQSLAVGFPSLIVQATQGLFKKKKSSLVLFFLFSCKNFTCTNCQVGILISAARSIRTQWWFDFDLVSYILPYYLISCTICIHNLHFFY